MDDDERQQLETFVEQLSSAHELVEKLLIIAQAHNRLDDKTLEEHLKNVAGHIEATNTALLHMLVALDGIDLSEWPI